MSMIDTLSLADFGGAVKKAVSKFHYGHHPSIIMWSKGPAPKAKTSEGVKDEGFDFQDLFGGAAKKLSDTISGENQNELFNSFKFDAMVSEEHVAQASVTKFPVSSGFIVSDHLIKHNRLLRLNALAVNMQNSAMWTASVQGISVISGALLNSPILPLVGGIAGTVATAFETEDRIQSTYDLFRGFLANGTKLYISTILGPYTNCVVVELKTKHDKMTNSILALEITLEELQVIGKDDLASEARKAMESMYDYSEFAKIAQGLGVGLLGGVALPGLGSFGDSPSKQLSVLKQKLAKLNSPVSSVKGMLL